MKGFFLLLCLLPGIMGFSQLKIKTDINSRGDTVYSTAEKKIYTMPGARNAIGEILKSSVYKFPGGLSLCLTIQTGRTSVFTISEGDDVELLLKDGSSLTLRSTGEHASRRSSMDYGCHLFAFYTLNSAAITPLRSQDIERITVYASLGKLVYDLKDKQSDTIREQVTSFK